MQMHNLSLSGCGFLGIYHIGVISAFREHCPEYLMDKISGCSAGSLVAACAICDCCLGQMVSDTLEIALKARSHALGPLHPSFNIVEILKNGLRRILPVDAHKICTDRLHVSITRWKDGKNFLVNKFESREDLIQALICSSFVPAYSGMVPPKFRGVYYWDGGLSNNNPILDQDTILVSPFGGESDICPREESSSYHAIDFQGTNIQFSHENIYRMSKALFPPEPEILKAMCFRGYKDGISFLKARNLLQCSCRFPRERISLSSVIGEDINELSMFDSEFENEAVYDSEDDKIIQYAHSNEPLTYMEMPNAVKSILDAACNDNTGFFYYLYNSRISRAISIMFIPWTLPVEFSVGFTKKLLEALPKIKVTQNPKNFIDIALIYLNFMIQKFTYDKYQYHKRVVCKLCPRPSSRNGDVIGLIPSQKHTCEHGYTSEEDEIMYSNGLPNSNSKICARHRQSSLSLTFRVRNPSISSNGTSRFGRKKRRTRSDRSSCKSDLDSNAGSVTDKIHRSQVRQRKRPEIGRTLSESFAISKHGKNIVQYNYDLANESLNSVDLNRKEKTSRVHFHLSDEESKIESEISPEMVIRRKMSLKELPTYANKKIPKEDEAFHNLTDDTKVAIHTSYEPDLPKSSADGDNIATDFDLGSPDQDMETSSNLDTSDSKSKFGWDNYWDKLESNVLGQPI